MNKQQEKAIKSNSKQIVIFAGPGTGKTFVISNRVEHLAKVRNVDPKHIMCITFTRKAAMEMKERIQNKGVNKVVIGTFHSICWKILLKHGQAINLQNCKICSSSMRSKILRNIIEEESIDLSEVNVNVSSAISEAKNKCMTAEDYKNSTTIPTNLMYIYPIYKSYEKKLQEENLLDFDDILWKCKNLLSKHENIRRKISNMIHYLYVFDDFLLNLDLWMNFRIQMHYNMTS